MRGRKMKFWQIAAVVLLLAAGAGGVWSYFGSGEETVVPSTVAVSRGDIEETVLASGILEARRLVSVGAQVSGRIESLNVELGQVVEAGDIVAEIDATDQQNAVKSAEASLANIQAQKSAQEATDLQNRQALSRASDMLDRSIISQAEYETYLVAAETSAAQIAALDAQIELAEITVESAKLNLARTEITAPISGTVVAVVVEEGQTINASASAPTVIKIANLDEMLIKAEISEADVIRVTAGQRVYFTILGDPDTQIDANLLSVEPAPSSIASDNDTSGTGTAIYYNGTFIVPNPDHMLRISMTAEVTIVIDEATNVLTVPSSVLTGPGPDGGYMVQIYDEQTGETAPRQVQVGLDNSVLAEIVGGLEEGEQVVSNTVVASSTAAGGFDGPPGGMLSGGRPPGM